MKNTNYFFKGKKPLKTIRSTQRIIGGLLLLALSLFMLCCIFLFGLKAETGRVFLCLFFGVPGALGLAISILILCLRVEVFNDGFAEKPIERKPSYVSEKYVGTDGKTAERLVLEKQCVLYNECVGKIPVYTERANGEKYLHHYIIKTDDGSQATLALWEMKPELTDRLKLDELPVLEIKGL